MVEGGDAVQPKMKWPQLSKTNCHINTSKLLYATYNIAMHFVIILRLIVQLYLEGLIWQTRKRLLLRVNE